VDEDAVVDVRQWLDRVGERRQVEGGLGLADGQDVLGLQAAQCLLVRGAQGLADLGVHIERVLVTGMVQRPVAGGLVADQPGVRGRRSR
jgi:hypothetical protein